MQTHKILILDDHQLFADGLALILSTMDEHIETTISSDALEALGEREFLLSHDLVLIDLHMPKFTGFGFLTAIQTQEIPIDVAVISGSEKLSDVEKAIRLGAKGFIPKDSDSSEMLKAVNDLINGKRYLPIQFDGKIDWVLPQLKKPIKANPLTKRQTQVLGLMCDGMQNKQIAAVLGISTSSVKGHIELLFKHLNVNNRTACVNAAREKKMI